MPDQESHTPDDQRPPDCGPAIDWKGIERATHIDLAGRNLAGRTSQGGIWTPAIWPRPPKAWLRLVGELVIVTGFCRSSAQGMTAETDGPPERSFSPARWRRWESIPCWSPTAIACRCWRPAATTSVCRGRLSTICRSKTMLWTNMSTAGCRRAIAGARHFLPGRHSATHLVTIEQPPAARRGRRAPMG